MNQKTQLALCGALLLIGGQTRAQEEEQGGETDAKEVAPTPEPKGNDKESAPGETHTVVKGDTLWDLSQRYLGSPWYWPKVWSYNPEIANPHWIYPGNMIRFFPTTDAELPTEVEVGKGPQNEAPAEGEGGVSPSEMIGSEDEDKVEQAGKIGFTPKAGYRLVHQGFATQKEVDEAGVIVGSFSEALMLSYPDIAYVQLKNKSGVKPGDRFVIFRTEDEIEHPVNGGRVGYLTHLIGTMKVTRVSERYVSAQIQTDTWDEVRRGDYVGPFSDRFIETISPKANERELKGYVVSSQIPYLALLGEHQIIVIDRGSSDGVQPGNTFTIVRRQDPTVDVETFIHPAFNQDSSLPEEDIGVCMAVDVKDRATMCLVQRTIRDLERGDQVRMRVNGQAHTASR